MIPRIIIRSLLIIILQTGSLFAQGWEVVPNTPVASFRHDDVSFATTDSGVITNTAGLAFKTHDSGITWDTIFLNNAGVLFIGRSVAMLDGSTILLAQYGQAPGNPNPADTNVIYRSVDQGMSWTPVTNFSGPKPVGICGMCVVNDSTVAGVGRWEGSPTFIRTTNRGNSFFSKDMSQYSSGLIDCYFHSADTGFAVGRSPNSTPTTSVPVVLYTTDGGQNWQPIYTGSDSSRWCWKIFFSSRNIGYISVENHYTLSQGDTNFVLKTTNGGMTWQKLPVFAGSSRLQGIGFVNDSTGWTGQDQMRKTTDGGLTWTLTNELEHFNRMRKINDSVFVAVGKYFSKYDFNATSLSEPEADNAIIASLVGYPNPFNNSITINYHLKENAPVNVFIYNQAGLEVYRQNLKSHLKGENESIIRLEHFSSGIYFLFLKSRNDWESLKLIRN